MRNIVLSVFAIFIFSLLSFSSGKKPPADITAIELNKHIAFLASDEMKGRKPGTHEDLMCAEYIRNQFYYYGLTLLGNKGLQQFEIIVGVEPGDNNFLKIENKFNAQIKTDYLPMSFSASGNQSAKAVFAGYGFDIKNEKFKWNDYQDINAAGKWVVILRGEPTQKGRENYFSDFSSDRSKVLQAIDMNAIGVLFVNPGTDSPNDDLGEILYDKNASTVKIPVFHITRSLANKILLSDNLEIESLENNINTSFNPNSKELTTIVYANADVRFIKAQTQNVIAMVEGTDKNLKDEYIVVGAHFDHLGMGGPGSGSRFPDTFAIHNGADDNASGVAGIIELAGKLNSTRKIKRSILFVAFTGEEMGLLGSSYFVQHCPVDKNKIKAMFNFDMIGRLDTSTMSLLIGGTGTSIEADSIINYCNNNYKFSITRSPEGLGPSDHASFYINDIPVFFLTTGANMDYHSYTDDIEKIKFKEEKNVLDFSYDLIANITNLHSPLCFKEAGPKTKREGGTYKVTLGILPDFAAANIKGLKVQSARSDGPAYKGGMRDGDIITAINGMQVSNIYDYMSRLKSLKSDQVISVEVLRNNQSVVLIIQL